MCRADIHCLIDQVRISSGPIRPQNISLARCRLFWNQFSPGGETLGCIDTHVHTKIVAIQLQMISIRLLVSGQIHCSRSSSAARRPIWWNAFKGTACVPYPLKNDKESILRRTRSIKSDSFDTGQDSVVVVYTPNMICRHAFSGSTSMVDRLFWATQLTNSRQVTDTCLRTQTPTP